MQTEEIEAALEKPNEKRVYSLVEKKCLGSDINHDTRKGQTQPNKAERGKEESEGCPRWRK